MKDMTRSLTFLTVSGAAALTFLGWWYYGHYASYPQSFKTQAIAECMQAGTSYGTCACTFGVVQSHYRYDTAKAFSDSGYAPQELKDAVQVRCLQAQ